MIICAQCGEHNERGARFCTACDAFLEWEGEPAEQQAGPPPVPAPAGGRLPPSPPGPSAPVRPAMQPTPPPAPPQTVAQPGEVQRQRPPPRQTPGYLPPAPGELICGHCGAGNAQERRFCCRCGGSLVDAAVVKAPWWRRLIPKRNNVKTAKAGSRKERRQLRERAASARSASRRVKTVFRNALAILLVFGAVGYATIAPFRQSVNDQALGLKDKIESIWTTKYLPVRPSKVASTAQARGHPAKLAHDNKTNTYWAAPAAAEPVLVLTFDSEVEINKAILRIGIADDFQQAHRPRKLHLVFSTGKTHDVELADTPDPQEITIENGAGTRGVEMHVTDLYRSLSGNDVVVSEVELFGPG